MPSDNTTYQVRVNEFLFSFSKEDIERVDLLRLPDNRFHLLHENESLQVSIIRHDSAGKHLTIDTGEYEFDVEIKDELDQQIEKMGFDRAATNAVREIKAPMPGLVVEIVVMDGQEVKEGERMLILEAMKMENSIMTPAAAKIKSVKVNAGQAVEKGQVLIELE
jgi:biotin carboxyl carrier protein